MHSRTKINGPELIGFILIVTSACAVLLYGIIHWDLRTSIVALALSFVAGGWRRGVVKRNEGWGHE